MSLLIVASTGPKTFCLRCVCWPLIAPSRMKFWVVFLTCNCNFVLEYDSTLLPPFSTLLRFDTNSRIRICECANRCNKRIVFKLCHSICFFWNFAFTTLKHQRSESDKFWAKTKATPQKAWGWLESRRAFLLAWACTRVQSLALCRQ